MLKHYGRIDILVNNAGVIEPIGTLETCDPETWAQNIMVNLVGVFHCCRAVHPHFRQTGRGIIINLSSGAAHRPLEGWSAYCAAKAGVAMLTRSVALEAGGRGVRVYGFQPGVVATDMQGVIRDSGMNEVSRLPEVLPDRGMIHYKWDEGKEKYVIGITAEWAARLSPDILTPLFREWQRRNSASAEPE